MPFRGQSHTPRWRQLYFTTYDLSFLCISIGAWGWWLKGIMGAEENLNRRWRCRWKPGWPGVWSLMGAGILAALFYLRTPVISSRYLLDFAPGFAATHCGPGLLCMEQMVDEILKRPGRKVVPSVLTSWLCVAWSGHGVVSGPLEFWPTGTDAGGR